MGFQGLPHHSYPGIWAQMFYELEQGAYGRFYRMLDGGIHCRRGFDPPPVLPGMPMPPKLAGLRDAMNVVVRELFCAGPPEANGPGQDTGPGMVLIRSRLQRCPQRLFRAEYLSIAPGYLVILWVISNPVDDLLLCGATVYLPTQGRVFRPGLLYFGRCRRC